MSIKIFKSDVIWGYLGTLLYSGINVILLPVIMRQLPANELGLWYTFTSIGTLASFIDFGFVLTISRNVSYAWSGAKRLSESGIYKTDTVNEPNIKLFSEVFVVSKAIYLFSSVVALALLSSIGTIYIVNVAKDSVPTSDYLIAWSLFIISVFLNIYFAYWAPVLKGIGAIKQNYQALVYSKLLQLITSILGLLLGYKLLAVSLGFLIGHLSYRVICGVLFHQYPEVRQRKSELKSCRVSRQDKIKTFKIMWPNAYKQGLMSFSKFLTDKFSIIICSAFLGLEVTAMYGVSMQLFGLVSTFAHVLYNTYLPLFNQLRVSNDQKTAYKYFSMSYGVQSATVILGGIAIILFANPILSFINSQSSALSFFPSILLFVFFYIHTLQGIFVAYIITSNQMPMFKPYIICAFMMVFLQFICSAVFPSWGVWSIIVPMVVVEAAYNGWRWPLYVLRDFNISLGSFLKDSYINAGKALKVRMPQSSWRNLS